MSLSRMMSRMCVLGLVLTLAGSPARGDQVLTVSIDTSSLVANYQPGPFGIDFLLTGTYGNTVTLTNFSFGAGGSTVPGTAILTNGAIGDLSSSVNLTDSVYFFNDFNQGFTPGLTLTFTIDYTVIAPPVSSDPPDNFSMVIYNDYNPAMGLYGTPIPTTDVSSGTLFNFDIDGSVPPNVLVYSTPNEDVTAVVTAASVPEPSSAVIMLLGVLGISGTIYVRRGGA